MINLKDDMFKLDIRSQLNMIYCLSKLLVSLLDQSEGNYETAKAMRATADSIIGQSGQLYCIVNRHIKEHYGENA